MTNKDDDNNDLAHERTKWAEDRTLLASERTFSSWMGTGLGSLGLAVGMQAVFGAMEPTWVAKSAATIFVLIAVMLFVSALRNAQETLKRLNSSSAEPISSNNLSIIAYSLTVGALGACIVLWMI